MFCFINVDKILSIV